MKLLRFLVFGILAFMLWPECIAAEWQWSVQILGIISNETDDHPQAFLWIPSDCARVKGVMIGTHNMTEETLFENPLFREKMSEIDMGLIWITPAGIRNGMYLPEVRRHLSRCWRTLPLSAVTMN